MSTLKNKFFAGQVFDCLESGSAPFEIKAQPLYNEKNEANNQGNEFVDQILDALPDPSTKVLASLKSLTDATSYTGTDAKLQIPGIVLPAVGMLIPETVLWEGTQLDMGSYMELLPGSLVTVVRSLFTIAIVLYCVYEFIGLNGFCLTLRGGD